MGRKPYAAPKVYIDFKKVYSLILLEQRNIHKVRQAILCCFIFGYVVCCVSHDIILFLQSIYFGQAARQGCSVCSGGGEGGGQHHEYTQFIPGRGVEGGTDFTPLKPVLRVTNVRGFSQEIYTEKYNLTKIIKRKLAERSKTKKNI